MWRCPKVITAPIFFRERDDTLDGLEDFLTYDPILPVIYVYDFFDCSESSVYLEWALEDAGFDAELVCGPSPGNPEAYYCWVLVHTSDNTVAVEATGLMGGVGMKYIGSLYHLSTGKVVGIVYRGDYLWENYYEGYDWLSTDGSS